MLFRPVLSSMIKKGVGARQTTGAKKKMRSPRIPSPTAVLLHTNSSKIMRFRYPYFNYYSRAKFNLCHPLIYKPGSRSSRKFPWLKAGTSGVLQNLQIHTARPEVRVRTQQRRPFMLQRKHKHQHTQAEPSRVSRTSYYTPILLRRTTPSSVAPTPKRSVLKVIVRTSSVLQDTARPSLCGNKTTTKKMSKEGIEPRRTGKCALSPSPRSQVERGRQERVWSTTFSGSLAAKPLAKCSGLQHSHRRHRPTKNSAHPRPAPPHPTSHGEITRSTNTHTQNKLNSIRNTSCGGEATRDREIPYHNGN